MQQGSEHTGCGSSERAACRKEPHQPERKRWGKSWTRRQELHDPGYYAAFPWEATLGRRGRPERAATPLAHALYIPLSLSPASSTPGSFIRPRWLLTEKYTEGLHPERPARGAVLYTGLSRPCIEHKGPPSTKNMHTKDGHDSRGRNYKAETQLPTFAWASLPI